MELTYHRKGDYLFPNLVLEPEEPVILGKYGHLRRTFLKEHRHGVYQALLLEGKLNRHLAEIEESADDYFDSLTAQMAKEEGVTEKLKAQDQMEWVRRMNSIRDRADEIILRELIYS